MTDIKFPKRRFIVNFVDGYAEFNENDTPPAEEYLSLQEHEHLIREARAKAFEDAARTVSHPAVVCFVRLLNQKAKAIREGREG